MKESCQPLAATLYASWRRRACPSASRSTRRPDIRVGSAARSGCRAPQDGAGRPVCRDVDRRDGARRRSGGVVPSDRQRHRRDDARERRARAGCSAMARRDPLRRLSPAARRSPLAVRELRLQPAVRLLLRPVVARRRLGARSGSKRSAGSPRSRRRSASAHFSSPAASRFCCRTSTTIHRRACRSGASDVLTNGMLFRGPRLDELKRLPRDRVTSCRSVSTAPTPALHDLHRGARCLAARDRGASRRRAARDSAFAWRPPSRRDEDEAMFCEFLDRLARRAR